MIKSKTIKDALAKGKTLRAELDKKAEEEAKKRKEQRKAKEASEKAALRDEAKRLLSYVPESLAEAIANRKSSFTLNSCESGHQDRFHAVNKLLEPKLKKLGLKYEYTSDTGWVQLSYDPDTGYEARYYYLKVIIPDEGK